MVRTTGLSGIQHNAIHGNVNLEAGLIKLFNTQLCGKLARFPPDILFHPCLTFEIVAKSLP
jgi:hypothetical protein